MKKIILFLFLSILVTGVIGQNYIEVKTSDLPKKIPQYFKKTLVSYSIGRSAKMIDKGVITYYVVAESRGRKGVYTFDKNGNFLGRESNMKDKVKAKPATTPAPAEKKPDDKTAAPVRK